jgi:hypothetical protein
VGEIEESGLAGESLWELVGCGLEGDEGLELMDLKSCNPPEYFNN